MAILKYIGDFLFIVALRFVTFNSEKVAVDLSGNVIFETRSTSLF